MTQPMAENTRRPDSERTTELRAQLAHRDRQITAIRRTSDVQFTSPGVDAIVRTTLEIALDVLRADAGTVFLHEPEKDVLVARYVIGGAGERFIGKTVPATMGIAGTVFQTQKPLLTGNVQGRPDFNRAVDKETGFRTQSMMTVPVKRSGGNPIGVMQVMNPAVAFTEMDLDVLQALCDQAATGIEHAKLVQEAKKAEIVHALGDIYHDIANLMTPADSGVKIMLPLLERLFEELEVLKQRSVALGVWNADTEYAVRQARDNYPWLLGGVTESAEQVMARAREIATVVKGEFSQTHFQMTDFNELCRRVGGVLQAVAVQKKIQLVFDLAPDLPTVECDRKRMYNALYNLIHNAIPFTPEGGSVTIRTFLLPKETGSFGFSIQDTGVGMPENVRQRILSGDPISTKVGGTGLGTRIVLKSVRDHFGTLNIESQPGRGTRFTITLPLRQSSALKQDTAV